MKKVFIGDLIEELLGIKAIWGDIPVGILINVRDDGTIDLAEYFQVKAVKLDRVDVERIAVITGFTPQDIASLQRN